MVINNSINVTVGETPHFLLYGYCKRLPISLHDDARPPNKLYNYEDFIGERIVNYFKTVRKTREKMKESQAKWEIYYKCKEKEKIRVGTQVYVKKMVPDGPNMKLSAKFDGPYRVLEILKNNKYRLLSEAGCKESIQHYNHIKISKNNENWSFQENGSEVEPHNNGGGDVTTPYNLRPRQ